MIRAATMSDIPSLEALYGRARLFMVSAGNPGQWEPGFPGRAQMERDIACSGLYVDEGEDGEIFGCFAYLAGPDPDYARIYDGAWADGGVYDVVHRFAVGRQGQGRGTAMMGWATARAEARGRALRIDTHRDNLPMQGLLAKAGFVRCGTIRLGRDGAERIAYTRPAQPIQNSCTSVCKLR